MSTLTILVVDDNICDRILVAKALQESNRGTVLQMVSDGEEALNYLHRQGKYQDAQRPQLILLDLNLPRKDGRQVLTELKADPNLKDIPVVVWTGAGRAPVMAAFRKHKPDFCLAKPDELVDFFNAVRTMEDYAYAIADFPEREEECLERLRQIEAA
jgi:CheY-like chemotaxis protein